MVLWLRQLNWVFRGIADAVLEGKNQAIAETVAAAQAAAE